MENSEEKDIKTLLIFDKKGDYYCTTNGCSNAAKITNGNPSNIHRAANNSDIISTGDFYFVDRSLTRVVPIDKIEKAIKIIIACRDTIGLSNRIREVLKITNKYSEIPDINSTT